MDMSGRVAFRALSPSDREQCSGVRSGTALRGTLPGRRAEGGGFMLVIRGLAHMDARLERSAATARRVVPRGAAPMYAMAKVARFAQRRPGAPA